MTILIPKNKRKVKDRKCVSKALAYIREKRIAVGVKRENYDIKVSERYAYYPYWILRVDAYKNRILLASSEAHRKFYITCDAMDGSYIVLQSIPKLVEADVDEDDVLAGRISEEKIKGPIFDEAVDERINRQFIFGGPRVSRGECRMCYLPMVKVSMKRRDQSAYRTYYANIYTGEIKSGF